MEKQLNSSMCFVCGIDTPIEPNGAPLGPMGAIGLKLKFYTDGEDRCIAHFQPKPEHQGYPGQLHGGMISALLDALMKRVQ